MLILHATKLKLAAEGELRVPTFPMYRKSWYKSNNTIKMAKVHFYEVAVRDYESYTPLLLHLYIVKILYSYFSFGLVEKSCKKAVL